MPGALVRYRSGFFGISDENIKAISRSPVQTLVNALTSPFGANEIELDLNAMFVGDAKRNLYIKSFVHIDGNKLTFVRQQDGNHQVTFDLVAMAFGDNGVVSDELSKTYTMSVNQENYKKMVEDGFVYYFTFPVKKPGAYQLRIAVRDTTSNLVGSAKSVP